MTSYPAYNGALRDSLITNASEIKDYIPWRASYLAKAKNFLSEAKPRVPKDPPPAKSPQPTKSSPARPLVTRSNKHSESCSPSLRRATQEPLSSPSSSSLEYIYVAPGAALPQPLLPRREPSWVFDDSLWVQEPTPLSPDEGFCSPQGDASGDVRMHESPRAKRTSERRTVGASRSHAVHHYPTTPATTTSTASYPRPTVRAMTAPTSRQPRSDCQYEYSPGGAGIWVYAERCGADPFWCIAYISGWEEDERGNLKDAYTVLCRGSAQCARGGFTCEVRLSDEPFRVGTGARARTVMLADLRCMRIGWLDELHIAKLLAIAMTISGAQSYWAWVYALYRAACEAGLPFYDQENVHRRLGLGPSQKADTSPI